MYHILQNCSKSSQKGVAESTSNNDKVCLWQKLNEEALAHATMQYNVQVGNLRSEAVSTATALDKERATREKLETEVRNQHISLSLFLFISVHLSLSVDMGNGGS